MKWFKYGCFACLGIVAVAILVAAVVGGLALNRSRSLTLEERVATRDLPEAAGWDGEGVSPQALAADVPGGGGAPPWTIPGRVILDLSAAEFVVEPAAEGEPIRVEGRFDPRYYTLHEEYSQAEDGSWEYRVHFRRIGGSGLISSLSELIAGVHPSVRITLPPDHPMALDMEVKRGSLQANLGGLWITAAQVEMALGGIALDIDEPLQQPMESLVINGHMGGMSLNRLGNASPARLELDYSIGGLSLDMRGAWINDAEVFLKADMGGVAVRMPLGVNFEGLPADVEAPEAPGPGAPTLRFHVREGSGNLEFVW